jgi:hypothetical protein
MTRSLQGFLEELPGRSRVSLSGKPEVDRGACGIDGTIQVPPTPTLANVGFVDPPRAVGWFQFPPTLLVKFRCIALHPGPNRGVVGREPRSISNSSSSRCESENRRYQRTARTMISGSKGHHLNSAGRGLIVECTAAFQTRSLSFLQHSPHARRCPAVNSDVPSRIRGIGPFHRS